MQHQRAQSPVFTQPTAESGIVLVIALVMLAIISLLAVMTVRNTTSSEAVNGNVRLQQLATEAAEFALRYCEDATGQLMSGSGTLTSLPTIQEYTTTANWTQGSTVWDATPTVAFVIPLALVNAGAPSATYARPPECIVEHLSPSGSLQYTSSFVVTARGFGPEVAAATSLRARPQGSEVFLQSTIELN